MKLSGGVAAGTGTGTGVNSGQSTPATATAAGQIFRRKTENLDWRQIASIDINQLIQSSSPELIQSTLVDALLPQITHCCIEKELLATDTLSAGFVKVFQLAQLLIEYLHHRRSASDEINAGLEARNFRLAEEIQNHVETITALKGRLDEAKRELKKRKEMLASRQVEILGLGNKDEYDQCPYCAKKFITSMYLLSHMQRRHQGLPLHPMFGHGSAGIAGNSGQGQGQHVHFQNMGSGSVPSQVQVQVSAKSTVVLDSDRILDPDPDQVQVQEPKPKPSELAHVTMSTQTMPVHDDSALEEDRARRSSASASATASAAIIEETEQVVARMKLDMDVQWENLTERIQQTGIEELKLVLMDEIHKMKDIITASAPVPLPLPKSIGFGLQIDDIVAGCDGDVQILKTDEPEIIALNVNVEQRFRKQEQELELLRQAMQLKMQEDVLAFDGKLQAQERFWRMKLRQVEEQYQEQAQKLREQITVQGDQKDANTSKSVTINGSESETEKSDATRTIEKVPEIAPAPVKSVKSPQIQKMARAREKSLMVPSPKITPKRTLPGPAVPTLSLSPRRIQSQSPSRSVPIPKSRRTSTPIKFTTAEAIVNHEYEEPDSAHLNQDYIPDYKTTDDDDEHEHDRTEPELSESDGEKARASKMGRGSRAQKPTTELQDKMLKMERIRAQVLVDVDRKMIELGIKDADGGQLQAENMTKALVELKRRRKSLENTFIEFPEEREKVKADVFFAATSKTIANEMDSYHQGQGAPKHTTSSNSPLVKMLSAVRSKGKTWKNRMVRSLKKKHTPRTILKAQVLADSLEKELLEGKRLTREESEEPENGHRPNSDASFLMRTRAKFSRSRDREVGKSRSKGQSQGHMDLSRSKGHGQGQGHVESKSKSKSKLESEDEYISENGLPVQEIKSKSILKGIEPVNLTPVTSKLEPELGQVVSEGEERDSGSDSSSSSVCSSSNEAEKVKRGSEIMKSLAKSLSGRRNNPETYTKKPKPNGHGHGQKHGHYQKRGEQVKRHLLKDFEAVEVAQRQTVAAAAPTPAGNQVLQLESEESSRADSEEAEDRRNGNNGVAGQGQGQGQGHYVNLQPSTAHFLVSNPTPRTATPSPTTPTPTQPKRVTVTSEYESETENSGSSDSYTGSGSEGQGQGQGQSKSDDHEHDSVQSTRNKNYERALDELKQRQFLSSHQTPSPTIPQLVQNTTGDDSSWDDTPPTSEKVTTPTTTRPSKIPQANSRPSPSPSSSPRTPFPVPIPAVFKTVSPFPNVSANRTPFTTASNRSPILGQNNRATYGYGGATGAMAKRPAMSSGVQRQADWNSGSRSSPIMARTTPPIGSGGGGGAGGGNNNNYRKWQPPSGKPRTYTNPQYAMAGSSSGLGHATGNLNTTWKGTTGGVSGTGTGTGVDYGRSSSKNRARAASNSWDSENSGHGNGK